MKIGLIVLSIGTFGKKGFYNLQEIGLAKALDKYCEKVKIFKLVSNDQNFVEEPVSGTRHTRITYIPSKSWGTNGFIDLKKLDISLDVYICFSDTQLMFPKVYNWAKKYAIPLLPYIGVTRSHNANLFKAFLVNLMFARNLNIYRKSMCLTKTPSVQEFLQHQGVKKTYLAPVGLDLNLVKEDYKTVSIEKLKMKYGYHTSDQVILFIGRLIDEKQPLRIIDIFYELYKKRRSYKLLMIGHGDLKKAVISKIYDYKLINAVQMIDCIPNCDIWELYCLADTFVNLNKQEIFGMAILEAMYYGCKVVAWSAPGPDFIIENEISGRLVHSNDEVIEAIQAKNIKQENAVCRVIDHFTWESTAKKILKCLQT